MLGAEGVARAIIARLEERMPLKIDEMRRRLTLTDYELPQLKDIFPTEINLAAINTFPVAAVVQTDTTGSLGNITLDIDDVRDVYGFRYRMRVFLWAAADDVPATDLLRKRLALAIREVVFTHRIMTPIEGTDEYRDYAEVDPQTVRESYSEVGMPDGANQFLGGAFVEFEVTTQEAIITEYPAGAAPPTVDVGVAFGDTTTTFPQP